MTSEMQIPVWLDCDPGHDDAFAILVFAHHPSIAPLGITTVHGNASLVNTTRNALSLLTSMSSTSIPVYPGASCGLSRPAAHAADIHGESGLDGTNLLPTPAVKAREGDAIDAMASALKKTATGTAWIVATGALTNVARLLLKYPDLASHIKGVSIMGGAIGNDFTNAQFGTVNNVRRIGNWTIHAEFNILVDPEAATLLFDNPILNKKITLIPLDVTHLALGTKEVQNLLLRGKNGVCETSLRTMFVELLTFYASTYANVFGITEGPPLHDPLAMVAIFDGIAGIEIQFYDFEQGREGMRERYSVHVVTDGSHEEAKQGAETGRTVVTLLDEGEDGVKIPRGLDVGRFWGVLEDCLERADAANKTDGLV